MKTVGIVTFHRAHNYGAVLQAYALQETLRLNGFNPVIIDYYSKFLYGQYEVFKPISLNPLKTIKHLLSDIKDYTSNRKRYNAFNEFIQSNLKVSKRVDKATDISNIKADILITGSDQVWNINITNGIDDFFYLNLPTDAKKMSYAASLGNSDVVTGYEAEYVKALNRIDKISVRESSAKNKLNCLLDKDIKVVLDPTLLLDEKQWTEKLSLKESKREYIFTYSVGRGSDLFYRTIDKLKDKTGLESITYDKESKQSRSCYTDGPREFVERLYNAKYVVTSSFHGLVFSILFHKNVFVIANNKPERLLSLLKIVGLEKCVVSRESDIERIMDDNIDWKGVDSRLDNARKESVKWLIDEAK